MSQLHLYNYKDYAQEDLAKIIAEQKAEIFRLHNVIENLPGSIYWKDKDGIYLGRNSYAAQKMQSDKFEFEQQNESFIGKTDYDLFSKPMADEFRKNDLEVLTSGKEMVKEEQVALPNGEVLINLSCKRPLYDELGNIVGIVGNTVDITYLKKIEQELIIAKEKSEQANQIKSEFIRNMEHDIRTPVSGVFGLANYLWRHETDCEKKDLLASISNCAKELLDYCNGILDYSKVELDILPIIEKKFSMRKLIDSIIAIEEPPARLKELPLKLDYDAAIPDVLIGDAYRLQRILINIISNAIKFTHQGEIGFHIKVAKVSDQRDIILQFTINDTGVGIPQEKQDFIYEKFTRTTAANRGIYKGIGLGLRIVKKFVEEMQGEIDLISSIGKGSSFICTLPFKLPLINQLIVDENG